MTREQNGNLPPGWTYATIHDLIPVEGVFSDGDWVESKDQDANGDVRLIQLADVGDGQFINKSNRHLTKSRAYELGCTFLKKGDLLIARMPDPLGRCCIFPLTGDERFVTVVDVCVVRLLDTSVLPQFLMHLLNSPSLRAAISDRQSGSTRKRISRGNLAQITLPIPPLGEQRRIVAKIEELFSELDKGIEVFNAVHEQLKAYRQSVLKHAFEGKLTETWRKTNLFTAPGKVLEDIQAERGKRNKKATYLRPESRRELLFPKMPEEWGEEYLGNLNVDVFDGPFGSNLKTSDYVETGVRVIRLENIGFGRFIEEKRSFVSEEKYGVIKKHTVIPGDIVFSSFVIDVIRSALIPTNISFAVNKADCFGVRFFGKTVNSKFIQLFFQSRSAFKQIEGMIHGVGRPRINTTQLKEMLVPICSPVEQAIIVESLESILSVSDSFQTTLDTGLAQIAALRQSILRQAFAGQLVPQDPADEPASVLLDRIRAEKAASNTQKQEAKMTKIRKAKEITA